MKRSPQNHHPILAIDIGGTKVRLATINSHHQITHSHDLATPPQLAQFTEQLPSVMQSLAPHGPAAIGVASPGAVDRQSGTVGPFSNIAWPRFALRHWLQSHYHCPVIIEHDATAGAVCEALIGSAHQYRYQLYVTISTGIGSALTLDGKPLPGPHNTEGGHMLFTEPGSNQRHASYEYIASGRAIVRRYGKIAAQIRSQRDWQHIARQLALGLHNLLVATDPQVVVLGGGVSVHYRKFISPLRDELRRLATTPAYPLPPIVTARHIETAPLLGAALLAEAAADQHKAAILKAP